MKSIRKPLITLALSCIMITAWLLPVRPVLAQETGQQEEETEYHSLSGKCGANITYTLENGVLTLTGSGSMSNYYYLRDDPIYDQAYPDSNAPWKEYADEITALNLDDRITSIGKSAFWGLGNVTGKLKLPGQLKTIGSYAFYRCDSFSRSLEFPETLTSIGEFAFDEFAMNSGEDFQVENTLIFPKSVTSVGEYAFQMYNVNKVYVKNAKMEMGFKCITGTSGNRFQIHGALGSTAEKYAKANDCEFWQWTEGLTYYTVTFNSDGGSAVDTQEIAIGQAAERPRTPEKQGWYFMGWYLDGTAFDFNAPVRRDITLTAKWSDKDPVTIAPVLSIQNSSYYNVEYIDLSWDARSDERLLRYDIYRALGADGSYEKIGQAEGTKNSYTDESAACSYNRTKYHYKIQAVYQTDSGEQQTPFSNIVSTQGMIYGSPQAIDKECTGARITDASGNVLDSLILHVGEKGPELHVQLQYKDGSVKDWKTLAPELNKGAYVYSLNWSLSEADDDNKSVMGTDSTVYAGFLPTDDYLGVNPEVSGGSARLAGKQVTPGDRKYYITIELWGHNCAITMPFTVIAEDPDADYDRVQEGEDVLRVYDNTDDFWQAVRDSFRNRMTSFSVLMKSETYNEAYGKTITDSAGNPIMTVEPLPNLIDGEAFDFYGDRDGMRPGDGDYLQEGISSYQAVDSQVYYENEMYQGLFFKSVTYFSTKEQENWMDTEIDKMVNQPGGRFYSCRNKSDYEKIKAVYDYVSNKISWVDGTKVGIYHMAWSGLHDGIGTCQSYALLFYRLVRELGVSSRVLMGTDPGAHTYNIVRLGEYYYYIDCSNRRFLKGSKNFQKATLQKLWQRPEFQENIMKKISEADYGGNKSSSIKSVKALSDAQIKQLDGNMLNVADKMAASYKISGSDIIVSNVSRTVLMPVYGCSEYLGVEDKTEAAREDGYFLAFRISADKSKFTPEGRITVSFIRDGESVSKEYKVSDFDEEGGINVILKLFDEAQVIEVAVDFDANGNDSQYQEKQYVFNLSALKKQDTGSFGLVGEITDREQSCGIETSSPRIILEESGRKATAVYDSVAYSAEITLPGAGEVIVGNYAAVQVRMPESLKGTIMLPEKAEVKFLSGKGVAEGDLRCQTSDAGVNLFLPMEKNVEAELEITWTDSKKQIILLKASDDCLVETINPRVQLPKSVKFNGLVKTMYVGQTQIADTAIARNYERDEVHLVFTSSDGNIISVNRVTGEMQALKPGTATVTVTATDENGKIVTDKKGKIIKNLTASAKITVKTPTAPGGIKLADISDTSATVRWKANSTGQEMEIYAFPVNRTVMGKAKNNWKSTVENALKENGMAGKKLSSLSEEEKITLKQRLEEKLGAAPGSGVLGYASASGTELELQGLTENTGYVFYLRNIAQNQVGDVYFTGGVSGETRTRTKVLTDVTLEAYTADGKEKLAESADSDMPVLIINTDNTEEKKPAQLSYRLAETDVVYTGVSYKSTNTGVIKVDKKGKLTLGAQAGLAELYVTGKDSAGKVRESGRIQIRVIREPVKLANKTVTLPLGGSIKLRDMPGYSVKGTAAEFKVEKVDFEAALKEIQKTGCFEIAREDGTDAAEAVITAAAFLTDAKGNSKPGNSVKIPFALYGSVSHEGEAVSAANVTLKVSDMKQPSITKVIPVDTAITVKFKPAATVSEPAGKAYYYTAEVSDKTTGSNVEISPENISFTEESDSTAKTPLYTCVIKGLAADRSYSVKIIAHYDTQDGSGLKAEKASAAKAFKTLKPLLITGGSGGTASLGINYISLAQLRSQPGASGAPVTENIVLRNNETYVFMAQVSRLNRVLGTDKLKWTISSETKSIAAVKATKDTYQAQISTQRTGNFTVTVTSTVSKEVLAVFEVTVTPYQAQE